MGVNEKRRQQKKTRWFLSIYSLYNTTLPLFKIGIPGPFLLFTMEKSPYSDAASVEMFFFGFRLPYHTDIRKRCGSPF
jgi:hypothetical protein